MMEKWRRKGGMNLKKDYLLLILNIILIVCFVLVNLLNQTIFIIDSNIISISNFLSKLTTKYNIEDIEIDNESIDDVILKLYEDYEL